MWHGHSVARKPRRQPERARDPRAGRPPSPLKEATVVQGAGARQSAVPAAKAPDRVREPPHGVPGGGVPEHRRVLAAGNRDVHDPRRHVHAALRLLQRQDRQADVERPARAGAGGEKCRQDGPQARGDHERRPRRPPRPRRRRVRRRDPADPPPGAELQGGSPHARLPRRGDAARQGDRGTSRRVQPQRRGRPPPLSPGAAGVEVRALLPSPHAMPRRSPATKSRPSPA